MQKSNRSIIRRGISLLCVLVLTAGMLLTGCGQTNDVTSGVGTTDFPVTVNEVTIQQKPEGVAVLSDNLADVVLALNYEAVLKARTADCTQSDLEVLPIVEPTDYAAMSGVGATLALVDELPGEEEVSAAASAGVTLLAIEPAKSREDLERLYSQVGAALQGGVTGYEKGGKTAKNVFITIDDVERVIPVSDTPKVSCYLFDAQGHGVTGDMFHSILFSSAGLTNAATDCTGGDFPLENLKLADPSYIFCPTGVKAQLEAAEGYKDLTAVKEGRVYEMDPTWMTCQGRGLIQAVSFMAGTVFPELLEDTGDGTQSTDSGDDTQSGGDSSSSATSSLPEGAPSGELKIGDEGDDVLRLQYRLQELGYLFVPPTGLFAEGTEQCVKDFQLLNGMVVTGVADEATIALLFSDEAVPRNAS